MQGKLSVGGKTLQSTEPDETTIKLDNGIPRRIIWYRTLADGEPEAPDGKSGRGMDWEAFETALEQTWHPELGRPGVSTRLLVSLNYLKYVYDLSDEEGVLGL